MRLIREGPFDAIDDEDVHGHTPALEFQPKLVLKGGYERRKC